MSNQAPREFSARELADAAGSTVRTIHYYAAEGLLPPPSGATRNATYTAGHLARLRLIAALREEGLSLAAIRARIAPLTDEQVLAVAAEFDRHVQAGAPSSVSTLGLIEAVLATYAAPEEPYEIEVLSLSAAPQTVAQSRLLREEAWDERPMPVVLASAQPPESQPAGTARDYLDRVLRRPPAQPAPPLPRPQPPRPQAPREPKPSARPEVWYHFPVDDGVELRVREDRYHQAKGRLNAVTDSMRTALKRYGLARDAPDDEERRSEPL